MFIHLSSVWTSHNSHFGGGSGGDYRMATSFAILASLLGKSIFLSFKTVMLLLSFRLFKRFNVLIRQSQLSLEAIIELHKALFSDFECGEDLLVVNVQVLPFTNVDCSRSNAFIWSTLS